MISDPGLQSLQRNSQTPWQVVLQLYEIIGIAGSLGKCRCLTIPQQWVTARCYTLHFDLQLVMIGLRCSRWRVARTWTLNAHGLKWSYATSKSIRSNDSAKTHWIWPKNLAWSHVPNFCNLAVWSLEGNSSRGKANTTPNSQKAHKDGSEHVHGQDCFFECRLSKWDSIFFSNERFTLQFSFNNFQTLEGFQSLAEFGRAGSIEWIPIASTQHCAWNFRKS